MSTRSGFERPSDLYSIGMSTGGVRGNDEPAEMDEYDEGGVLGASYSANFPSGGGDGEQERSELSKFHDAPQVE